MPLPLECILEGMSMRILVWVCAVLTDPFLLSWRVGVSRG